MSNRTVKRYLGLAVLALGVTIAGCSAEDPAITETTGMVDMDETFSFGEPVDGALADRVIEIEASDGFAFDPSSASASVGEADDVQGHQRGGHSTRLHAG